MKKVDFWKSLPGSKKRYVMLAVIVAALIYPGYQLVNHYLSDRTSHTTLTFLKTDTNIITKAEATYEMNFGEGNLQMTNNLEESLPNGCLSSIVELDTINGSTVSNAELKIYYDDSNFKENELDIALAKIENGVLVKENFKIDVMENYISASVQGEGKWCLADISSIK